MTISFNQIPQTLRLPAFVAEFNNAGAVTGSSVKEHTVLLLGQKLSAGTQAPHEVVTITSDEQADTLFGAGSMLASMVAKSRKNGSTRLKAIALQDDGGATAATAKVTFSGTATAAGSIAFYVAGYRFIVGVDSGDTAVEIASALNTKMGSLAKLQASSAINGTNANEIDLTHKNACEAGNTLSLKVNYQDGDGELPAGVAIAVTAFSGGAGNPSLTNAIAAFEDEVAYTEIGFPYTDATSTAALKTELLERWGPLNPFDGTAIATASGVYGALASLGLRDNDFLLSISANQSLESDWEAAAAKAMTISVSAGIDPARPYQTLPLAGLTPLNSADRLKAEERNLLLFDGIATQKVVGSTVQLERVITNYRLNSQGAPDTSYLELTTIKILSFLRFDFNTQMSNTYPRHKLSDDRPNIPVGQPIITPSLARAKAVEIFLGWQDAGLVEGIEQFKEELSVERSSTDANRLNFLLPPDLINQFIVGATQIAFKQ